MTLSAGRHIITLKPLTMLFLRCLLVICLSSFPVAQAFSQAGTASPGDSIELPYPFTDELRYPFSNSGVTSPLYLNNPSNVVQTVVYDPVTNQYVFSEKIGKIDYRPPSSMTMKEYLEYDRKTSVRNYWHQRARETIAPQQSNLLANIKMGETFDKVFGTDAISIVPQGSAELIFGYNMSRIDNPALSERNRRNGSFLFKEKIQMNVTGSIGDKMQLGINYNTEANLDFENKTKLEYTGKEDEIIKKIEAGNVTFTVPGTLITGSQSLFGLKTDLQFGKLFVSSVFSHQRGQSQVIEVKGGAQVSEFEIDAADYDANRHFFLSHFFRDNYSKWLESLPYVNSGIRIEQIEVWVTNKSSSTTDTRNILALMDLGEGYGPDGIPNFAGRQEFIRPQAALNLPVSNVLNGLYTTLNDQYAGIRTFSQIAGLLAPLEETYNFYGGRDFEKIENARRLAESEYKLNAELGYVSLNSSLRSDEVLAVAYVFTYQGKTYRMGELSTDGISAPKTLMVKLLKGTSLTPKLGTWDLMMKNVYAIGAYQVSNQDFLLDILYRKDETGVPVNYIAENGADSSFNRKILLRVMKMDNLDTRNEPSPDGRFDFIAGTTINPRDGRIFFTQTEPFGNDLRRTITGGDPSKNAIADKYVFEELYDSTQTKARQITQKNKFFLSGSYQSSSSSEIQLNAMNVPQGSVKVSSGGIALVENQDYTVDYTLGRVKILNQGLIESGAPLSVSLENNALFNLQTKTLMGTHLDYRFSDNFNIGGTLMNLTERPLTQKVNIGDEPISNTIWGLNTSYRTDSRLMTKLIDKLPLIETKETSSFALDAEFAQLIPGQAKIIGEGGVAYIDDFEGTETTVELKTIQSWFLSSTPRRIPFSGLLNDLRYGYNRSKLAWYSIDPLFTRNESRTPDNISKEDQNDPFVREVLETEIFKNRESGTGFQNTLLVMNLAFFPEERGPYNFDLSLTPDGRLTNPQNRWGGIMREIQTSDFETSNIEYIEFWLMDPFVKDSLHSGGDLYFNLGEISEDVLKDSRKSFENGLPTSDSIARIDTNSVWGRVPTIQSIVNSFDADPENRAMQDVGLDGMGDEDERLKYSSYLNALPPGTPFTEQVFLDPSNDNFRYFLSPDYGDTAGIISRYKAYNNTEGNSPTTEQSGGDFAASTTLPNTEDINRDNTLNETDAYYEYHVRLEPEVMNSANNYITDIVTGKDVKWYQFRIPVDDFNNKYGNIEDFKSIRFMRMYLTGFSKPVILRFAELHLVRSEWRKFSGNMSQGGPSVTDQFDGGNFEITSVNIEENAAKSPVNYILPPGIDRVVDPSQPQVAQLNEQSIVFKLRDLPDGDARVAYKNINLDLRQYKKLRMFSHAEALINEDLNDYDLTAFIRIGSDQTDNYYEYEVPLLLTPHNTRYSDSQRRIVWPDENLFEIDLESLVDLKVERDKAMGERPDLYDYTKIYRKKSGKNQVKVKGSPNLSNVRTILIGVRNANDVDNNYPNDGLPKSAEIWFNELRLTDFNNKGGWAANARAQMRLADLGILSVAGSTSKPGFGSIEQKVDDRNKEETNQIDVSSNIELGKLLPEKAKVSVPLYVGVSQTTITPEYSPQQPDRLLKDVIREAETAGERREIKEVSQDVIKRNSINLTNVRVNQEFEKFRLLSPSNFSLTAGYSETQAHSYEVERNNTIRYGLAFNYVYSARPKIITPFKSTKGLKSPYLRFIRDFNFSPLPSRIAMRTDFDRMYNESKLRNVYRDRQILIDSTVSKDFIWNRGYELNWDLTRSLKFDLSINNQSRIDENPGAYDLFRKGNNSDWSKSVWKSIMDGGRPVNYDHSFNTTYNIPLNKFPVLSWTSLSLRYNSTYSWTQGPVFEGSRSLGNTIANSNTIQASSTFNMTGLYGKSKFLKRIDSKYSGVKQPAADTKYKTVKFSRENFFLRPNAPRNITHKLKTQDITVRVTDRQGQEIEHEFGIIDENRISISADTNYTGLLVEIEGKVEAGQNPLVFLGENSIRLLTGLKNISVSYSLSGGSTVMGFMPEPNVAGFNTGETFKGAPGLPFLLGYQDRNFVREAASKGWLTTNPAFSNPYTMSRTENFNIKGTYEPFKGFRVELSGLRTYTVFTSEYFYHNDTTPTYNGFYFDNRLRNGGFSMSVITIGTAFEKIRSSDGFYSTGFERFKRYRTTISHRLYNNRVDNNGYNYQGSVQHEVEPGYSDGYGSTSPEVIIPAFLAAYTNRDPENINLRPFPGLLSIRPNWRLTFDGLPKIEPFKRYLKSANILHSYRSVYSINSYTTNFLYEPGDLDGLGYLRDYQDNFIPELQLNTVSIREDMNPLIGFDGTWVNNMITRFEFRKSRILALSLANNQLTESLNNELIVGAGYRFREVPLKFGEKAYKSDLNVKFDLSVRDNKTIIRYLAQTETDEVDQITLGDRLFKIMFTADYLLSPRFNLQFFFDRTLNKPHTSRSFLRVDTNIGFSLRFTLTK
ncbi:MAG TPA: cell surface protein SprA [Bacteroidales bacterium]|nr:cell surface protein SprA [Bacteroidales bacterium]